MMLAAVLALSGCTKDQSPKDALQASMSKSADMTSFNFKGSMTIEDFNFPDDEMSASEMAAVANLLKSAELSWTGAYRADPMLAEVNLQLALKGDLAITFNVPMVMTEKKIWIKIPNIPMLPIPETIVNKFVEVDLEKLAEETGEPLPKIDMKQSQQFSNDVSGIVFKHVEEGQYLSDIAVKDAGLPADVDAKQVVQFRVDQTQLEPFINTVIQNIAPEVIDLLSKNQEYRDMLQLTQEDLDEAKKLLDDTSKGDIADGLEEMKKELKSFELVAKTGIDKKEFPVYTDAKISASIESEELTGSFAIKLVSQTTGINEEPKFEIGEPKAEEIVPMEELEAELGGMFGGDLEGFDESL